MRNIANTGEKQWRNIGVLYCFWVYMEDLEYVQVYEYFCGNSPVRMIDARIFHITWKYAIALVSVIYGMY